MAGKVERGEDAQGLGEAGVGELVADAASFGGRGDEAALAQAAQVVRQVRAGGAEAIGELGGIAGSVEEVDEDAPARRVGESGTHAAEGCEIEGKSRYSHT